MSDKENSSLPHTGSLILVSYPFIEIFSFLAASHHLGVAYVIGWTMLTILAGILGLRRNAFLRLPAQSQLLFVFGKELANYDPEIISLILEKTAYILILFPGLLTDAAGILLLVTPLRKQIAEKLVMYLINKKKRELDEQAGTES